MEFFPTTAEALTVLLHRKQMTGRELAKRAGLHPNTVSAYLRGKLWPATVRTIAKLTAALEVDPAWLTAQLSHESQLTYRGTSSVKNPAFEKLEAEKTANKAAWTASVQDHATSVAVSMGFDEKDAPRVVYDVPNEKAPPGGGHARRGQGNTRSPRSSP